MGTARIIAAVPAILVLAGCSASAEPSPLPAPLTEREVTEILATEADIRWAALEKLLDGAPQPEVEFVQFATRDTWPALMAQCMRENGVESVSVRRTGGLSYRGDGPGDRIVFFGCSVAYPLDPRAEGYMSVSQRGYLWDYWTTRTRPCLLALGFPVPAVPGRLDFINRSYAGTSWDPYQLIDEAGVDWDEVDAQCPPLGEPYPILH